MVTLKLQLFCSTLVSHRILVENYCKVHHLHLKKSRFKLLKITGQLYMNISRCNIVFVNYKIKTCYLHRIFLL